MDKLILFSAFRLLGDAGYCTPWVYNLREVNWTVGVQMDLVHGQERIMLVSDGLDGCSVSPDCQTELRRPRPCTGTSMSGWIE